MHLINAFNTMLFDHNILTIIVDGHHLLTT